MIKRKPLTPAEKKRRQRERDKALGVAEMRLNTTEKERELIVLMAERHGFDDRCEYIMKLVLADSDTSLNHNCAERDVSGRVAFLKGEGQ